MVYSLTSTIEQLSLNQANQEWTSLQYQFDAYEKYSLIIKLVSVCLVALAAIAPFGVYVILLLNFILWGQDAIWKTFQGRIFTRLLTIEKAFAQQQSMPIAFNLAWLDSKPGSLGLVKEYAANAFKPTVLFPHVFLVGISVWLVLNY